MGATAGEVVVRLPHSLAEFAGGRRELSLPVDGSLTLGGVLDLLALEAPAVGRRVRDERGALRRFVNAYVGEDECRDLGGVSAVVAPGAVVTIIPSIAGG